MKNAILISILVFLFGDLQAQFEWEDPLDHSKEWLVYNLIGVAASKWLGKDIPSAKGWYTDYYAEYQQEYGDDSRNTDVFAGKVRLGYQFRKWVSMGGEAQFYKFKNAEVSTLGLGGAIFFNWNLVNRSKLRLYFDNGFGVLGTLENFPKGGTSFNFSTNMGIGADIKIREATQLKLGVRNMHVSNAYLFGDDRNPAFDSIGFLVGFQFN